MGCHFAIGQHAKGDLGHPQYKIVPQKTRSYKQDISRKTRLKQRT
jgi:hypothetical protein